MDALKGLSEDILEAICHQLETLSTGDNIVLLKHEKNKNIFTLSMVCKSWHRRLTSTCKALFQDIAFHISSLESIVTAQFFLDLLEGSEVPTYVYADLGHYLHPAITKLFAKLRTRTNHIVHFEYHGDMDGYRSHLNSPAPNLLFFSDNFDTCPGQGPPLFCGYAPKLRALTTLSQAPGPVWITSLLPDLTHLDIGFLELGVLAALSSFLELLRGSPRLETLSAGCFVPLINPNEDPGVVFLPCLHTLRLEHNEFHTIIKRLTIPNVRKITYNGESHPVCGGQMNPTFTAAHVFLGLPLLPIFERPIKKVLVKTMRNGEFCFSLSADGGFSLYVWLDWVHEVHLFDGYAARSIAELVGMITLAPDAHVQLVHPYLIPSDIPIYRPFLRVSNIDRLTIRGGFAAYMLNELTVSVDHITLLPRLRLLDIVDRSPFANEDGELLLSCLHSRSDSHFSIRLVDEGIPPSVYMDSRYAVQRKCQGCSTLFCL